MNSFRSDIQIRNKQCKPEDINEEKVKIQYQIQIFQVIGLFIGYQGTIPKLLSVYWSQYILYKKTLTQISLSRASNQC